MILPPYDLRSGNFTSEALDGGIGNNVMASSVDAYGAGIHTTANRAVYIPFAVHDTTIIDRVQIFPSATGSGNLDIGIYDGLSLAKLVSTGSLSTVSFAVAVTLADTTLVKGFYYFAIASDVSTVGQTYFGWQISASTPSVFLIQYAGVKVQDSAFTLPATATLADPAATLRVALFAFYRKGWPY